MLFQTNSNKQIENRIKIGLTVILGIKFVVVGIYVKNSKICPPLPTHREGGGGVILEILMLEHISIWYNKFKNAKTPHSIFWSCDH